MISRVRTIAGREGRAALASRGRREDRHPDRRVWMLDEPHRPAEHVGPQLTPRSGCACAPPVSVSSPPVGAPSRSTSSKHSRSTNATPCSSAAKSSASSRGSPRTNATGVGGREREPLPARDERVGDDARTLVSAGAAAQVVEVAAPEAGAEHAGAGARRAPRQPASVRGAVAVEDPGGVAHERF